MIENRNYNFGQTFITFNEIQDKVYFLQRYNLPGFTIGEATQSTPYQVISVPGSSVSYNPLNASFILDEDMKVWYDLWKWMFNNNKDDKTSDFSMHIWNNTVKRYVMRLDFIGAWVQQENDINDFTNFATNDDTQPRLLDVLFKYAYYKPILLNDETNDIIIGS